MGHEDLGLDRIQTMQGEIMMGLTEKVKEDISKAKNEVFSYL